MQRGPTNPVAGPANGHWTTDLPLAGCVQTTVWTQTSKHALGGLLMAARLDEENFDGSGAAQFFATNL